MSVFGVNPVYATRSSHTAIGGFWKRGIELRDGTKNASGSAGIKSVPCIRSHVSCAERTVMFSIVRFESALDSDISSGTTHTIKTSNNDPMIENVFPVFASPAKKL